MHEREMGGEECSTFEIIIILVSGCYRLVTITLLAKLENAFKQRIR